MGPTYLRYRRPMPYWLSRNIGRSSYTVGPTVEVGSVCVLGVRGYVCIVMITVALRLDGSYRGSVLVPKELRQPSNMPSPLLCTNGDNRARRQKD